LCAIQILLLTYLLAVITQTFNNYQQELANSAVQNLTKLRQIRVLKVIEELEIGVTVRVYRRENEQTLQRYDAVSEANANE